MFSGITFILFGLVSITGGVIHLLGSKEKLSTKKKWILSYFIFTHMMLVYGGIMMLLGYFQMSVGVVITIFILSSRVLNGYVLFKKVNWHHYVIVTIIIVSSMVLYHF